jgi:hypothetical protein
MRRSEREILARLGPCQVGKDWYNSQASFKDAWENCHRGDWLWWFAYNLGVNSNTLLKASIYCVKQIYPFLIDERSKDYIVAAINYSKGYITDKELNDKQKDAYIAWKDMINDSKFYRFTQIDAADLAWKSTHTISRLILEADIFLGHHTVNIKSKSANICRKYLTEEVFIKLNQIQ